MINFSVLFAYKCAILRFIQLLYNTPEKILIDKKIMYLKFVFFFLNYTNTKTLLGIIIEYVIIGGEMSYFSNILASVFLVLTGFILLGSQVDSYCVEQSILSQRE